MKEKLEKLKKFEKLKPLVFWKIINKESYWLLLLTTEESDNFFNLLYHFPYNFITSPITSKNTKLASYFFGTKVSQV